MTNITKLEEPNVDRVSTLGFTDDQTNAYGELIQFINADYNPLDYKRALVGAAGTGKTYLVKALIRNCKLSYSVIGLSAPTHKAARILSESIGLSNVKINTLQSDLGLKLNLENDKFDISNPPFDPRGRIKIGSYQLYIVDEASMISRSLMLLLEKIAKTNKVKVIYIGDSYQLPPVGELYSPALKGVKTYELKQIVRQEEDNPVRYLLDLLRYDITHKTFRFLEYISKYPERFDDSNIKGYKVCTRDEFANAIYTNFSDEQLTKDVDFCKVIAFRNVVITGYNNIVRNSIIKDANKSAVTKNDLFLSYITIVNQFNEAVIKNSEDYIIDDVVNYTHPKYEIDGFMCRFVAIHGGKVTKPLFILDHTKPDNIKKFVEYANHYIQAAKSTSNSSVRAQRWKDFYELKESCLLLNNIVDTTGRILYGRSIDYGFALTAHKSQGSTFDTTFVDVNDIVFDKNGHPYTNCEEINRRLYVACSRCRNKLYLRYGR